MCESCGPHKSKPIDPEVMQQFRKILEKRGIIADAAVDPECFGNRRQKFKIRLERFVFNFKILLGRV